MAGWFSARKGADAAKISLVLVRYSAALLGVHPARRTTIVAVDGFGGAGKSHFAANLAAANHQVTVVHTDDFASWDDGLDWQRLRREVIDPLMDDRTARYQRYDWVEARLAEWHDVPAGGTVVVEGVSSYRLSLSDAYDLAVWVESPRETCLRRGLERDGQGALAVWERWMVEEDAYVAAELPDERAAGVVDGAPTVAHAPGIEFVALRWP
jgi:uridine kinase